MQPPGRGPGHQRGQAEHRRGRPLAGPPADEVAAGGAQHEAADPLGVAAPDELGDRAPHRVADRDEPVDAEHVGQRDGVVGAVLEAEPPSRPDAAAVAAVVDRHDVEVSREHGEAREPVERRVGRPPVQQDQRRRAGRTGGPAVVRDAAVRGARRRRPPASRAAGSRRSRGWAHVSMLRISTLERAAGSLVAGRRRRRAWSSRAAPSGEPGDMTSRSSRRSSIDPMR